MVDRTAKVAESICRPIQRGMRLGRAAFVVAAWATLCAGNVSAGVEDEVRATFESFVAAQNAHDAGKVAELLQDSADFLWITRGIAIWGRDASMKRFASLYEGTWKLDPDWASFKVIPLGSNSAQLMVPVTFIIGPAGQPGQPTRMFLSQALVKTNGTWRIASILPVPAAPPQ